MSTSATVLAVPRIRCSKCGLSKKVTDFSPAKNRPTRHNRSGWCKACKSQLMRSSKDVRDRAYGKRKGTPEYKEYMRYYMLQYKYGLSREDFEEMLLQQGYTCAGCSDPFVEGQAPHVDHDHTCCPGKGSCGQCVRGLLCRDCNHAVGNAHDNPSRLRALASYLERF